MALGSGGGRAGRERGCFRCAGGGKDRYRRGLILAATEQGGAESGLAALNADDIDAPPSKVKQFEVIEYDPDEVGELFTPSLLSRPPQPPRAFSIYETANGRDTIQARVHEYRSTG